MARKHPRSRPSRPVPGADGPLERGNASGRATRELIMRTAERLFAERGLEGVALREIGMAAGQRNNYAIQYHFGDRDGLIMAIYEYRAQELNERRHQLLAELERDGRAGDPEALVHILLEPHARHIGDPESKFLGFLAQLLVARGALTIGHGERPDYVSAYDRIRTELRSCFPHLSEEVFFRRFDLGFTWAIYAMANYERTVAGQGPFALSVPQMLDELVVMIVGALGAMPASAPKARKERNVAQHLPPGRPD